MVVASAEPLEFDAILQLSVKSQNEELTSRMVEPRFEASDDHDSTGAGESVLPSFKRSTLTQPEVWSSKDTVRGPAICQTALLHAGTDCN